MLRLIRKWIGAEVSEDGVVSVGNRETRQSSAVSPLLVNVDRHCAFDLWVERRQRGDRALRGRHRGGASSSRPTPRCFQDAMRERLAAFALSLHPDKTRLIPPDRIRPLRDVEPEAAGPRQARHLHVSRLHLHLLQEPSRPFPGSPEEPWQPREGDAEDREGRAPALDESAHPLPGTLAEAGRHGYFNYHAVSTNSGALARGIAFGFWV